MSEEWQASEIRFVHFLFFIAWQFIFDLSSDFWHFYSSKKTIVGQNKALKLVYDCTNKSKTHFTNNVQLYYNMIMFLKRIWIQKALFNKFSETAINWTC